MESSEFPSSVLVILETVTSGASAAGEFESHAVHINTSTRVIGIKNLNFEIITFIVHLFHLFLIVKV